jgi:hypothetical protein
LGVNVKFRMHGISMGDRVSCLDNDSLKKENLAEKRTEVFLTMEQKLKG